MKIFGSHTPRTTRDMLESRTHTDIVPFPLKPPHTLLLRRMDVEQIRRKTIKQKRNRCATHPLTLTPPPRQIVTILIHANENCWAWIKWDFIQFYVFCVQRFCGLFIRSFAPTALAFARYNHYLLSSSSSWWWLAFFLVSQFIYIYIFLFHEVI